MARIKLKKIKVKDGVPHKYYLNKDGIARLYTKCCDCGLIHYKEFKPINNYIEVKVWRDDERTEFFKNTAM